MIKPNVCFSRILALDVRMQKCGFAILEGQNRILEWGITHYRHSTKEGAIALAGKRVTYLLMRFQPSIIALKYTPDQRKLQYRPIVDAIFRVARQHQVAVALVERKELQSIFRQSGNTKYAIAGFIAGLFPELASKLPKTRKWYDREPHNSTIFDAVSVGLAYLVPDGQFIPHNHNLQSRTPG